MLVDVVWFGYIVNKPRNGGYNLIYSFLYLRDLKIAAFCSWQATAWTKN